VLASYRHRGITIPLLCPKIQMEKNTIAFEGAMSEPLVYLNGKKKWVNGRMAIVIFILMFLNSFKKATIL
jgi:hypothetical protein